MSRVVPRAGLVAFLLVACLARAHTPVSETSAASGGDVPQELPAAPAPATVYVYRNSRFMGMLAHSFVFVGADSFGELDNSRYIRAQVPAGSVAVTATGVVVGHPDLGAPPISGYWSTLGGCSAIDWRQWASAQMHEVVAQCMTSLQELGRECGATVTDTPVGAGWVWRKIHIPACNPQVRGAEAAYNRLSLASSAVTVSLRAEPGATYYLRWSLVIGEARRTPGLEPMKFGASNGQHLDVVDAVTGTKELASLHEEKTR